MKEHLRRALTHGEFHLDVPLKRRKGWRLAIRRPGMALAHFRLLRGVPLRARILAAIRLAMV